MATSVRPSPTTIAIGQIPERGTFVKTPHDGAVEYLESAIPQEMVTTILFEEIGAIELINMSRHDIIDGIPVNYTLVGNLTELQTMFNSNNIVSGFETRDTYFNQFPIDIGNRMEEVYFNDDGDLVIELSEMGVDESVEVMVLADGIIYTV